MKNNNNDIYSNWLVQYKWESFATIRTPTVFDANTAYKTIQSQIVRPLARIVEDQIGGFGTFSKDENGNHVHILLLSKRRDSLKNISYDAAKIQWTDEENLFIAFLRSFATIGEINLLNHRKAIDIRLIISKEASVKYFLKNLNSNEAQLLIFNKKVIYKHMDGIQYEH